MKLVEQYQKTGESAWDCLRNAKPESASMHMQSSNRATQTKQCGKKMNQQHAHAPLSHATRSSSAISFNEAKLAASGRWLEILPALGVPAETLTGKHTYCAGCGGKNRFRWLNDENGGWICGQGGTPTGGDGFALLVHVFGWTVVEAKNSVAEYLALKPDTSTQAIQQRRQQAIESRRIVYEEALLHELRVLSLVLSNRIIDKSLARDRKYTNVVPWFRPMPPEHWAREKLAARRIGNALGMLYEK